MSDNKRNPYTVCLRDGAHRHSVFATSVKQALREWAISVICELGRNQWPRSEVRAFFNGTHECVVRRGYTEKATDTFELVAYVPATSAMLRREPLRAEAQMLTERGWAQLFHKDALFTMSAGDAGDVTVDTTARTIRLFVVAHDDGDTLLDAAKTALSILEGRTIVGGE